MVHLLMSVFSIFTINTSIAHTKYVNWKR